MPQILIRAGRATEIMRPERRSDLDELVSRLRSEGMVVDLQLTEHIPGRRGIVWGESVAIYIAGAASGAVISNIVGDIYKQAKSWAAARFKKKQEASGENGNPRPESFTILGPDGKVLRTWKIDRNGEHEE